VINHFKSLVGARTKMVTAQRPALEAVASNTDYEAAEDARIAEAVVDHDLSRTTLELDLKTRVRMAQVHGEAWLLQEWDSTAGRELAGEPVYATGPDGQPTIDPSTGQPVIVDVRKVHSGDITHRVLLPIDVIRDFKRRDADHRWSIARVPKNRFELAAQYPEHGPKIIGTTREPDVTLDLWDLDRRFRGPAENVDVYILFHLPTPALPDGRRVEMVGGQVLLDTDMPYDAMPLDMLAEETEDQSCFGHSPMVDLIAPQQMLTSVDTAIATNHDAHAVQNVWSRAGSGLTVEKLSNGMMHWQTETDEPPQGINLTAISEHSYAVRRMLLDEMNTLSGVNATTRGNPSENIKSGAFAALVQATAIQAQSGLQSAYVHDLETVLTKRIRLRQKFQTAEQLIDVVGADERYAVERFTGENLSAVRHIIATVGNPLMRTPEGRRELGKMLLDTKAITEPQQFLEFLDTGRFEPLYHYPTAERRFVRWENQQLIKALDAPCMACMGTGQPQDDNDIAVPPTVKPKCRACGGQGMQLPDGVEALAIEAHEAHEKEHTALLHDPGVRKNPQAVRRIMGHIQQHKDLRAKLLDAEQQAAAAMQSTAAPANDNGAAAPQDMRGAANDNGVERAAVPGAPSQVAGVKLPAMPTNPSTGQRVPPNGAPPAAGGM
jgi:hypothetical protein